MMNAHACVCRDLVKIYGTGDNAFTALRGVDLTVDFGELMMLVGPSGCGKTTLISVLAGILDRSKGECRVLDEDVDALSQTRKTLWRGERIGFVFQAFNLIPALTAAENAAVPLMVRGVSMPEAVKKARVMLDRVGLGDKTEALPAALSGGQQQRVAVARSLVHDPKLVVCDEPTSALDADTGGRVMEIVREIAVKPDRAVIVVTHDARIFKYADRIAKMSDGRIESVDKNHTESHRDAACPTV